MVNHVTNFEYILGVKKVPFSYRHRRTWPRLMKWLSMKIFVIQPHSCMRLREGFFPHWSILNGHFTKVILQGSFYEKKYWPGIRGTSRSSQEPWNWQKADEKVWKGLFLLVLELWIHGRTYQCHFRWLISWTRPYHRTVRPVRTIWHVIRIQPFGLRSSFFLLFSFFGFLNLSFWNWKKRKEANHHPPSTPTQKNYSTEQIINANCNLTGDFRF